MEDSTTGIASAANAGIGLIVGYVGGSHIARELEDLHAESLLGGSKSMGGRGADIVVSDFSDLPRLVHWYTALGAQQQAPYEFPDRELLSGMKGRYWLR